MKNAVYFISKAVFAFKIYYALTFWLYRKNGLVNLNLVSFKIYDATHNLVNKQLQFTYCPIS